MRKSLRAPDSFIEAHVDLFHYVVEISPRTVVPSAAQQAVDIRLLKPSYDAERPELSVADVVARRLSRPAKNLELVLEACQEDGGRPQSTTRCPADIPIQSSACTIRSTRSTA